MGKLIKCHWARLILLSASVCQIAASISGLWWPKIFFDFLTRNMDIAVKPIPYLQIFNILSGLLVCAFEWPIGVLSGSSLHRSIETRLIFLPLTITTSILMYQSTNPAIFYSIGLIVYFWAYSAGECVPEKPWSIPSRTSGRSVVWFKMQKFGVMEKKVKADIFILLIFVSYPSASGITFLFLNHDLKQVHKF